MRFFGSDEFLETLGEVRFPGRPTSVMHAEVETEGFRLLGVGRGSRPVKDAPFLDFHSPLTPTKSPSKTVRIGWLPSVERGVLDRRRWQEERASSHLAAAPMVDWTIFSEEAEFIRHVKTSRKNLFQDSRRRMRRLEQDHGPVKMEFAADPGGLLESCIQWKSRQYIASGLPDLFSSEKNVSLFRRLAEKGVLVVSALFSGERLAAVHMGVVHDGRFLYWVPAYDPGLAGYAPGRLLLHFMLDESMKRRHKSFEFLLGDEDYKLHYATHVRLIGHAGTPPVFLPAWRRARAGISSLARGLPPVHRAARTVRNRLVVR